MRKKNISKILIVLGIVFLIFGMIPAITGSSISNLISNVFEDKAEVHCDVRLDRNLFSPTFDTTPTCTKIGTCRMPFFFGGILGKEGTIQFTADPSRDSTDSVKYQLGFIEEETYIGKLCTNDPRVFIELYDDEGGRLDSRTVNVI